MAQLTSAFADALVFQQYHLSGAAFVASGNQAGCTETAEDCCGRAQKAACSAAKEPTIDVNVNGTPLLVLQNCILFSFILWHQCF